MILLGLDDDAKSAVVTRYVEEHAIRKVYVLSPARFRLKVASEHMTDPGTQGDGRLGLYIDWPDIIQYRYYYKLLQEVDRSTLIVVNECLRTQDRHDLTYNCIRHYLNQAGHQLVFQYLPLIDTVEDFMVLFDFDTRSRWKRECFNGSLVRRESVVHMSEVAPVLRALDVVTEERTKAAYAREKRRLIEEIGLKDPHTIPRNLYLMSGKAKLASVREDTAYIGRNQRFKLSNLTTYREPVYGAPPYVVFEFCHNFIDFADFLALSRQKEFDVLVADLKVDHWYYQRYVDWLGRIRDAYAVLRG